MGSSATERSSVMPDVCNVQSAPVPREANRVRVDHFFYIWLLIGGQLLPGR